MSKTPLIGLGAEFWEPFTCAHIILHFKILALAPCDGICENNGMKMFVENAYTFICLIISHRP